MTLVAVKSGLIQACQPQSESSVYQSDSLGSEGVLDNVIKANNDIDSPQSIPSSVTAWLTSTAYAISDIRSNGGFNYECITAHTSGTFSTDLTAAKWQKSVYTGNTTNGVFAADLTADGAIS